MQNFFYYLLQLGLFLILSCNNSTLNDQRKDATWATENAEVKEVYDMLIKIDKDFAKLFPEEKENENKIRLWALAIKQASITPEEADALIANLKTPVINTPKLKAAHLYYLNRSFVAIATQPEQADWISEHVLSAYSDSEEVGSAYEQVGRMMGLAALMKAIATQPEAEPALAAFATSESKDLSFQNNPLVIVAKCYALAAVFYSIARQPEAASLIVSNAQTHIGGPVTIPANIMKIIKPYLQKKLNLYANTQPEANDLMEAALNDLMGIELTAVIVE